MNYTVIAYDSDGISTCRGCEMDRWSSFYEEEHTTDKEEAIKAIVSFRLSRDNSPSFVRPDIDGTDCDGFVKLFINGRRRYDVDEFEEADLYEEFDHIFSAAEVLYESKIAEKKERERLKKEAESAREAKYKKEQDLKKLVELKAKYGEQ